jgi:hypothetical protein
MKKGVKVTVLTLWAVIGLAQVPGGRERWVRIGDLQNQFTACGFERAYTNSEYIGMRWPAEYSNQDNSVIERSWIGATNFTDAKERSGKNTAFILMKPRLVRRLFRLFIGRLQNLPGRKSM